MQRLLLAVAPAALVSSPTLAASPWTTSPATGPGVTTPTLPACHLQPQSFSKGPAAAAAIAVQTDEAAIEGDETQAAQLVQKAEQERRAAEADITDAENEVQDGNLTQAQTDLTDAVKQATAARNDYSAAANLRVTIDQLSGQLVSDEAKLLSLLGCV